MAATGAASAKLAHFMSHCGAPARVVASRAALAAYGRRQRVLFSALVDVSRRCVFPWKWCTTGSSSHGTCPAPRTDVRSLYVCASTRCVRVTHMPQRRGALASYETERRRAVEARAVIATPSRHLHWCRFLVQYSWKFGLLQRAAHARDKLHRLAPPRRPAGPHCSVRHMAGPLRAAVGSEVATRTPTPGRSPSVPRRSPWSTGRSPSSRSLWQHARARSVRFCRAMFAADSDI